jgi:hypothetical protein
MRLVPVPGTGTKSVTSCDKAAAPRGKLPVPGTGTEPWGECDALVLQERRRLELVPGRGYLRLIYRSRPISMLSQSSPFERR